MSLSTTSSTEERALKLLGQGLGPEIVASAVGVSVSRISQLLSDENFAAEVAELRFENLSAHSERDAKYDKIEAILQDKFEDLIPFMLKPHEVLKAIQVINAAKRRGSSAPEQITNQQTVVQLVMPTQIFQNFTQVNSSNAPVRAMIETNLNNQVIRAGDTELVTIQSSNMMKLLEASKSKQSILVNNQVKENNHVLHQSASPNSA